MSDDVLLQAVAAMSDEQDKELGAMQAVHNALAPPNRSACRRVLAWAEKRYTQLDVDESDLSALTTLTESVIEAARTIGNVTPADIIKFADGVIAAKAAEPDA